MDYFLKEVYILMLSRVFEYRVSEPYPSARHLERLKYTDLRMPTAKRIVEKLIKNEPTEDGFFIISPKIMDDNKNKALRFRK